MCPIVVFMRYFGKPSPSQYFLDFPSIFRNLNVGTDCWEQMKSLVLRIMISGKAALLKVDGDSCNAILKLIKFSDIMRLNLVNVPRKK
jgi:hypothetical protein